MKFGRAPLGRTLQRPSGKVVASPSRKHTVRATPPSVATTEGKQGNNRQEQRLARMVA
jgi:hypothetical protein